MVESRSVEGGANGSGGIGSRISSMFPGSFGGGSSRGSMATTAKSGGGGVAAVGLWGASNGVAIFLTAMAGVALAVALIYSNRGSLKSPWYRRRRKHALSCQQWRNLFLSDGRLIDGGVKFLKKVRSGGIEHSIRKEVWPFLLGVYELNSTQEDRDATKVKRRKQYENLRTRCKHLENKVDGNQTPDKQNSSGRGDVSGLHENPESPCSEDVISARQSISSEEGDINENESDVAHANGQLDYSENSQIASCITEGVSGITQSPTGHTEALDTESSDSESAAEEEHIEDLPTMERIAENETYNASTDPLDGKRSQEQVMEDYETWQRIIGLDAIRANGEWIPYSPAQAQVSEDKAVKLAESVGLKDYDCLEPCRIYHAARLVAILEAYTVYDPEIGYCQGMSDLLSPIISVIEEDDEAFWCFVGFMKNARHNFRLDEVGIRRQLNIVSKIIKSKDSHFYKHLEKLRAEDCFFVYRMVVVLFRRELNFEQTLCLWEVIWADQAAIRAGIGKSAWGRIRQRAPPTNDLLLYAIAACVLQRRKLIIEKYSSMDEIIRECNNIAGQLDVWKLLDDAHDLVVTLNDKI